MPVTFTTLPIAPTDLSLDTSIDREITLSWVDNSSGEDEYRIYRSTDGSSYSQIATKSANSTSYIDNNLPDGKEYWYYVAAFVTNGGENSTSSVNGITNLPRPTNVSYDDSVSGELTVSWTRNDNSTAGVFDVERAPKVGTNWSIIGADLSETTTSYTDTTISDATEYKYRIIRDTNDTTAKSNDVLYEFFPRVRII